MKYTEKKLKQAADILDLWIISEEINQSKCEQKLAKLGIKEDDISDMMQTVNTVGIEDTFAEIQHFSLDYIYDDEFIDHYAENVQGK